MASRILLRATVAAASLALAAIPLAHATDRPRREPRKVALMIGISDYAHYGASAAAGQLADLQGPENDVERLRVSLLRWGFGAPDDTRVLTGAAATRAGIGEGFRWVADRATDSSDAVVIFYSGHGSHAPDGVDRDEADGRDEGLVPFDAEDAHDPGQLVLDDEIRTFLAALGTDNVTIIIDACYSGTVTRGHGDAVGRDKGPRPVVATGVPAAEAGDFTEARGHTLITAARSDQTAQELPFDVDGRKVWIGAMTYHLTRALDGAAETRGLRYDELVDRLRAEVRGALLPQVPQLEGDGGAVVFRSNQGIAARPFVLASAAGGDRVTLDAGAIHGVRRSAVYDVFGAGELGFASRPVARVRIDSVIEAKSFGRVVAEDGNAGSQTRIPAGARAVPTRVPLGAGQVERLRVHVEASALALAPAIRADSLRFVLSDSAAAHATVTTRRGVAEVYVKGIPLPPQADEGVRVGSVAGYAPAALCRPLVRALSITALDAIANPAPPAELTLDARVVPVGSGEPRAVAGAPGIDTITIGKLYDIYVRADVPSDLAALTTLYLTAAIAGYTSDPVVLWPLASQPQAPIALNRWVRIARSVSVSEPVGSEILKVVVNSDQFDLRPLVQSFGSCDALRGARGAKGNWGSQVEAITGWTTLEKRIDIVR